MHYVIVSKDYNLKYETIYYETDLGCAKKIFKSLMCDDRFPNINMSLDDINYPVVLAIGTLSLRMFRSTHYTYLPVIGENIRVGYIEVPKQCVDPLIDHEWIRSIAVSGTDPVDPPFVICRDNIWELRFYGDSTFDKIKQNPEFKESLI